MTLRHMKIYVSVFRHSSMTKAADELHLAQPSVSFAVKELEEYYGIRLFERIGRHIYPTEAGREFYSYALHLVSLFEEMEKRIKNWDALGVLRIGSSITIGTKILPALIRRCQSVFPDLRIEAVVSNSADIEKKVSDNTIDMGLIETQASQPDLCAVPFMKDYLCAIAPAGHPLTYKKNVSLPELADYPFLMREKGSAGREILEAAFSISQISVRPVLESTSTQAIVQAVSQGLGVAVLPYLLIEKDIQEGTVSGLALNPPIQRSLNVIYHKSKYLTENMAAFLSLCETYGAEQEPVSAPSVSSALFP